jgi:hypothetical protein
LLAFAAHDPDEASRFLNPSLDQLHDPLKLAGLAPAVDRLLAAIANQERISVHGDYDVDGITSTVILRGPSRCSAGRWAFHPGTPPGRLRAQPAASTGSMKGRST